MNLIATSTFGLEAVVVRELEALGYSAKIVSVGRIAFEGDQAAIFRANTWLRCADRVLIEIGSFQATDFGELFDRTNELPWEQWIAAMPPSRYRDGALSRNSRPFRRVRRSARRRSSSGCSRLTTPRG